VLLRDSYIHSPLSLRHVRDAGFARVNPSSRSKGALLPSVVILWVVAWLLPARVCVCSSRRDYTLLLLLHYCYCYTPLLLLLLLRTSCSSSLSPTTTTRTINRKSQKRMYMYMYMHMPNARGAMTAARASSQGHCGAGVGQNMRAFTVNELNECA